MRTTEGVEAAAGSAVTAPAGPFAAASQNKLDEKLLVLDVSGNSAVSPWAGSVPGQGGRALGLSHVDKGKLYCFFARFHSPRERR